MKEDKNLDSSYQITFIKLVFISIFGWALSWILSYWLTLPFAKILSILITALVAYFYLTPLRKLGFLKWITIVILFTGSYAGIYYGNSLFGESPVWAGTVLAALGILSFFSNWIYLWIMSDGLKIENKDDLMTPQTWLLWSRLSGLGMILLGACVALGFFG